ncbi:protein STRICTOSIDINE SYNTHASE-LIKE 6-like [Wolffia australiana]
MGNPNNSRGVTVLGFVLATLVVAPVSVFISIYRSEEFNPASWSADYNEKTITVPNVRNGILKISEKIGEGVLRGPEDFAYDAASGFLYTGCEDGWIRRVDLNAKEQTVEDWAYVGGRPLGLAFGPDNTLFVASAYKGLLSVGKGKEVRLLVSEADGLPFGLIDGVDVASDGTVYFTDASHKYNLSMLRVDGREGRPYGRLMSYNPATSCTEVLLSGLYFANGVAVSPDQDSVVFCETFMRRCKRYHIRGEKKGAVDLFVDGLSGLPDNIRYDGDGRFWIGLPSGMWKGLGLFQYSTVRKIAHIASKYEDLTDKFLKDGGVLSISMEGEPLALYKDKALSQTTVGLKIGNHLYYGSLVAGYMSRIPLDEDAAEGK